MRVSILLTCGKHLYDCNISLREEVWTHKAGLTPPLVIELYEGSRDIERSCICVFGVLLLVLWLDCSDGVLFFIIFVTLYKMGYPLVTLLANQCLVSVLFYFKPIWIDKIQIMVESRIVQWQNIIYIREAGIKVWWFLISCSHRKWTL
jgi:hypothetical protein